MSNELTTTAIPVEIAKIKEQLAAVRDQYIGKVYDLTTESGVAECKADKAVFVKMRTTVEKARKAKKAIILAAGRDLDAQAEEITADILLLETPRKQMLEELDARIERERLAFEQREQERVRLIMERIGQFHKRPAYGATSADISKMLAAIPESLDPLVFSEYAGQAEAARAHAESELSAMLASAVDREEQDRLLREQLAAANEARLAAEKAAAEAEAARVAQSVPAVTGEALPEIAEDTTAPRFSLIPNAPTDKGEPDPTMSSTYPPHAYKSAPELLRKINIGLADRRFDDSDRLAWAVKMLAVNERLWK